MKFIALFLLLVLSPNVTRADDAPASLTLGEAQKIALANHPQIKASDYEAKAAEADITATRSGYFPQISGNAIRAFANPNTRLAATGGLNNPTVIDRGSFGIGASQLITDFGRTNAEVDAAEAALQAEQQRGNLTRAGVLLNVTRAYFNSLRAETLQKIAKETLKTRQTLLDQITSLHDVKMRSDLDLSLAKQGIDDANLLMLKAENGHEDSMAELSEALGYSDTHEFTLTYVDDATPPSGTMDSSLHMALANNPDLAALRADADAADHEATATRRAYYPTLSAVGFAGETPVRTVDQHINPTYGAGGVNLSIPIYTGGRQTADADKAEAKANAAKTRVTIKTNQLARDVRQAFDNVQIAYKNIAVTQQMRDNAAKSLDLTQARYDIGKSSIVDLSQAQLAATQAAVTATDAQYQYLVQRAVLDYTIGKFSVLDEAHSDP